MSLTIGYTGPVEGMTAAQRGTVRDVIHERRPMSAHHGCCVGGDYEFHRLLISSAVAFIVLHPPSDRSRMATGLRGATAIRPAKPYLDRNHDIVDESDLLVGTPRETIEPERAPRGSGTWATIKYARRVGKPVLIVWPDGSTSS